MNSNDFNDAVAMALRDIARGICKPNAVPWKSPYGGNVGDVTEAMIEISQAIRAVAMSLDGVAAAIEEKD